MCLSSHVPAGTPFGQTPKTSLALQPVCGCEWAGRTQRHCPRARPTGPHRPHQTDGRRRHRHWATYPSGDALPSRGAQQGVCPAGVAGRAQGSRGGVRNELWGGTNKGGRERQKENVSEEGTVEIPTGCAGRGEAGQGAAGAGTGFQKTREGQRCLVLERPNNSVLCPAQKTKFFRRAVLHYLTGAPSGAHHRHACHMWGQPVLAGNPCHRRG